jgi:hypothetical protein
MYKTRYRFYVIHIGTKKLIIGEKNSDRQIGDNHEGFMI